MVSRICVSREGRTGFAFASSTHAPEIWREMVRMGGIEPPTLVLSASHHRLPDTATVSDYYQESAQGSPSSSNRPARAWTSYSICHSQCRFRVLSSCYPLHFEFLLPACARRRQSRMFPFLTAETWRNRRTSPCPKADGGGQKCWKRTRLLCGTMAVFQLRSAGSVQIEANRASGKAQIGARFASSPHDYRAG